MRNIVFKLHVSRQYLWLMLLILAMSLILIFTLQIKWWWQVFLIGFVLIYGIPILRCDVLLRGQQSILQLQCDSNGRWCIDTRCNQFSTELLGSSTVTSWVSVLRFRDEISKKIKNCVIFNDALATDDYRQLLVMLRMKMKR